jgi:hypothetical protein
MVPGSYHVTLAMIIYRPRRGQESARVHSGYSRVLADGAAGGWLVLIVLQVRRSQLTASFGQAVTTMSKRRCPSHLAAGTCDLTTSGGKITVSLCCRRSQYGTRTVPLSAKAGGDDEGDAGQRPGSGHLAKQREPGD